MGFSMDGRMVGSSAMVGWMGKTGIPHIKQYYLRGQSASDVVVDQGQLLSTAVAPRVVVHRAKIYLAFQLKFTAPLAQQHLLFAIGTSIPVHNHLKKHADKTSISFDFSTGLPLHHRPSSLSARSCILNSRLLLQAAVHRLPPPLPTCTS